MFVFKEPVKSETEAERIADAFFQGKSEMDETEPEKSIAEAERMNEFNFKNAKGAKKDYI